MDRSRLFELLGKKLAGEASIAELRELDDYVLVHPDSIYYIEAIKEIWQDTVGDQENLDDVFNQHVHKFEAEFEDAEVKVKKRNHWYLAACLMPLIVISLVFHFRDNHSHASLKLTELISGKGIRRKLLLPDGTQVWLNADSKITFNGDNKFKSSREVTLIGEAFFDVVKDKQHPFVIHTPKFAIKVLGTAFDVKAYPKDIHTEATLLRGKIELTVNEGPQQKIILTPNEKFVLTEQSSVTSESATDGENPTKMLIELVQPVMISNKAYTREVAWVSDQLIINNETFEDLIPRLERWYNVKINISNPAIRKYKFTGILKNETVEQALSAMTLIESFKFKITANEVNIY